MAVFRRLPAECAQVMSQQSTCALSWWFSPHFSYEGQGCTDNNARVTEISASCIWRSARKLCFAFDLAIRESYILLYIKANLCVCFYFPYARSQFSVDLQQIYHVAFLYPPDG